MSPVDGKVLRIEEHTPEYYGMARRRDEPIAEWPLNKNWPNGTKRNKVILSLDTKERKNTTR